MPFVVFLIRVARTIASEWLVAGPHLRQWKAVSIDQLADQERLGWPYVIGWKAGTPAEEEIVSILGPAGAIRRTTLGYSIITYYPIEDI